MGQAISSAVDIVTTYSQNGKFSLRSIPFDNEFPTLRGKTSVYKTGSATPLYVFERGFDSVEDDSNNLILSNDGEVIFYLIPWGANEKKEGLKSITIYKRGRIIKSFTETEINGCDKKKERCSLVYSNYEEVVDKEESNWGTKDYRKVFKAGVDEKERFLSDYALFSSDDTVYLTDSKKMVHLFDLKEGNYLGSKPFEKIFEEIKDKGRLNRTELQELDSPTFLKFPRLKNGRDAYETLARHLGMAVVEISNQKDYQYKWYRFRISSNIFRDGSLEIEEIEVSDELPKEKIVEFFKANKFDSSAIPKEAERWYVGDEYFAFRKSDARLAREEKRLEKIRERQEFEKRLTLESIEGVYIPKNLGECFIELDKLLPEVDREEMKALASRDEMIKYHLTLGMWMRNNWGLWGGSRLQKYFTDKGVTHPESMSSVILYHYYDWLNGRKENWKDWEKNPKDN